MAYEGFKALLAKGVPAGAAANAGRAKYGKAAFQHAAATGRKMKGMPSLADSVYKKMNEDRVLKSGNPYEIARVEGKHVVRKQGGGHVFGTFPSYAAALKQFNLLESIEHKKG